MAYNAEEMLKVLAILLLSDGEKVKVFIVLLLSQFNAKETVSIPQKTYFP